MATVMVKTKHGAVIYVVMTVMAATVPMKNVAVAVAKIAQMVTQWIVLMRTVVQIHG
jgi:hypothetical protein